MVRHYSRLALSTVLKAQRALFSSVEETFLTMLTEDVEVGEEETETPEGQGCVVGPRQSQAEGRH